MRRYSIYCTMMIRKTIYIVIAIIVATAPAGSAQKAYHLSGGIAADLAGRLSPAGHNIGDSGPFFAGTLAAYIAVQGTEENALGFLGQAGIDVDHIPYKIDRQTYIRYTSYHLQLNGTIVFPTKNRNLDICAGIQFRYYTGNGLSYSSYGEGQNNQTPFLSMDLDSNATALSSQERKLLPGVQVGCRYRLSADSRWYLYGFISQQLLSEFDGDVVLSYKAGNMPETRQVNHQPTYIKLGAMWRL